MCTDPKIVDETILGTLSCATCHLHFTDANYAQIGEPNDEELDMLDKCYDGRYS